MKFGLNVIMAWSSGRQGVENVAEFLLDLAVAADDAGWDGFFLWDHVYFPWEVEMVDSWTVLAAIAGRTKRLRIGTIVTPLPRRRPHVVARQVATVDHLSHGRAVLGVGLGGYDRDYTAFGEEFNYSLLAEMADEALEVITGLWSGESLTHRGKHYEVDGVRFLPKPVQEPRIPVWVGSASATSRGGLRRAGRWDGWVTGGPSPAAGEKGHTLEEVTEAMGRIRRHRESDAPFDVVYCFDFSEDESVLRDTIQEADSAEVTWMLEGIYGLRYNAEQALERVMKGPP
jgi:alkanesulfonate monooxygenase SsuD/methylene tetrahydromethanopterin reductase-like flavin-dependent oxidoreductase (luciferase family)